METETDTFWDSKAVKAFTKGARQGTGLLLLVAVFMASFFIPIAGSIWFGELVDSGFVTFISLVAIVICLFGAYNVAAEFEKPLKAWFYRVFNIDLDFF